jgi:hypothetical protein
LGQRSRKRRSGSDGPASGDGPGSRRAAGDGPGSRRAAGDGPAAGRGGAPANASMRRGYARSRERQDAIRAALEPLAPGERPRAVTIAAVVAGVIAVANLALYLAGWDVRGEDPNLGGTLGLCGVMAVAAAGMWRVKYWAVLGFEVLLGVLVVSAALSLLLASNLQGVLLALAVIALAGSLFWFLIRAMARIQMPQRPRRESTGRRA